MPEKREIEIAAKLDARHAEANLAFANRDIVAYRRIFSSSLRYAQPGGEIINLDEIMEDVVAQFARLKDCRFGYTREEIDVVSPEEVTETLSLDAWVDLRVFFFFKRRWNIHRHGKYTWRRFPDGWQVTDVVVDYETVS